MNSYFYIAGGLILLYLLTKDNHDDHDPDYHDDFD